MKTKYHLVTNFTLFSQNGQTPLFAASSNGNAEVCKILITYGKADVNKATEVQMKFLINLEINNLTIWQLI